MITTREINVNLNKGKLKLRHVSTRNINAGVRVEPPKEPIKPRGVTTTTLPDVADIAEKKRRDDIAEERKLAMKDEKKIAQKEEKKVGAEIITAPAIVKDEEGTPVRLDEIGSPAIEVEDEKKPWKEMTDDEKKVEYKERAKRAVATRVAKKKKLQDTAKYANLRR